jgi:hypothetical protein
MIFDMNDMTKSILIQDKYGQILRVFIDTRPEEQDLVIDSRSITPIPSCSLLMS